MIHLTPEEIALLRQMPRSEVIKKYLKKLCDGEISKAQYDKIMEMAESSPEIIVKSDRGRESHITGKTQSERILELLSDHEWHDTTEIQRECYGADHLGVARIGARIFDLKEKGHDIVSRKKGGAIWEYRLKHPNPIMNEEFWSPDNLEE